MHISNLLRSRVGVQLKPSEERVAGSVDLSGARTEKARRTLTRWELVFYRHSAPLLRLGPRLHSHTMDTGAYQCLMLPPVYSPSSPNYHEVTTPTHTYLRDRCHVDLFFLREARLRENHIMTPRAPDSHHSKASFARTRRCCTRHTSSSIPTQHNSPGGGLQHAL